MAVKERHIWYFKCSKCGKSRRVSVKKKKAVDGICAKCRKNAVNKNQLPLPDMIQPDSIQ